jgi:hypothetical protein
MRWCRACGPLTRCSSPHCRAWRISHSGRRRAKQRFGRPALSFMRTRPTAERPSRALSKEIRSPIAYARSCTNVAAGPGAPQTYCACAQRVLAKMPLFLGRHGRKTRVPSRDDYAGAQTFLRMLGIEMTFAREGRSGARIIRLSALGQSGSSAVGMDRNDGQNERYRVNGEGWLPPQSSSASSVPSG